MIDEELPLNAVRGPLPLNDADFDAIRAGVMTKIALEKRSWLAFMPLRLAFASAAIAIVAISAIVILRHPERQTPAPAMARSVPAAPAVVAPPDVASAPETVAVKQPQHAEAVAHKHPVSRHRAEPHAVVPQFVAVASSEPVTIQLQTSNPDVRIIWIPR